jgi:hypothetical protein
MAVLRFYRPTQFADFLRCYRLFVDEVCVGQIVTGGELDVEVPAGRHEVRARIDWCSSNRLLLDIGQGDKCNLEVGSSLGGWRLLLALLYITLWTSDYLYLRAAERDVAPVTGRV